MEAFLFMLDVFFMLLLVWYLYRADRDSNRSSDLGFFAFREPESKSDKSVKSREDAHRA